MLSRPTVLDAALAELVSGAVPNICEPSGDVLKASNGAPTVAALTNERREMRQFKTVANGSLPLWFGAGLKHASLHEIWQWSTDLAYLEIQFNGAKLCVVFSELIWSYPHSALAPDRFVGRSMQPMNGP